MQESPRMGFFDLFRRKKTPPPGDDSAPGWDAIDNALNAIYGDQEPQHWGTVVKWMVGGPDPLDGMSAYRNEGPPPHWHFVSYGMTDLYAKEGEDADVSGWGFELTFRLPRQEGDSVPPMWALNFLQTLARYVFKSGNPFEHGHRFDCNGPIAAGKPTRLTAVLFCRDPQLPPVDTPHGRVEFLQIVGVTREELEACSLWNASSFLEVLRENNPLLITDLFRDSILDDEPTAAKVAEGQRRDGSSSAATYLERLTWAWGDDRSVITIDARSAAALALALRGRTLHGRPFALLGPEQALAIQPADRDHIERSEEALTLHLSEATARDLAERLLPKRGRYEVMPLVSIEVIPSVLRTESGEVVEEIG